METAVIIDIAVAAVLIGFLAAGAARGLFRSLAGLVIVVVALVGAGLMADILTDPVTGVVQPAIVRHIEKKLDEAITEPQPGNSTQTLPNASGESPEEEPEDLLSKLEASRILKALGVDEALTGSLAQQAQETVRETGVSIAVAVAEALARSLVHAVLFALCFLVLLLVLKLVAGALDLLMKLPGLHLCNRLGGALLGLLEGALLLFLAIWVLRRFGVSFETETIEATHLLSFFTKRSPLDLLTFL